MSDLEAARREAQRMALDNLLAYGSAQPRRCNECDLWSDPHDGVRRCQLHNVPASGIHRECNGGEWWRFASEEYARLRADSAEVELTRRILGDYCQDNDGALRLAYERGKADGKKEYKDELNQQYERLSNRLLERAARESIRTLVGEPLFADGNTTGAANFNYEQSRRQLIADIAAGFQLDSKLIGEPGRPTDH